MDSIFYQDSAISFKSDIIKELSEELNIPEKELEEIVNLNIKYIKDGALNKDFLLINIPNLCKIRFNYRLASSSVKFKTTRVEQVKRKLDLLKDYRRNNKEKILNFKFPLFEKLWMKLTDSFRRGVYKDMFRMIRDVEQRSNEIIQEITNK